MQLQSVDLIEAKKIAHRRNDEKERREKIRLDEANQTPRRRQWQLSRGGMEEKEEKGKKGWRAEEIVFGNTRHGSVAGIKYARLYTSTSIV